MTDFPDMPQGGLVRRDRLAALAGRVGPSLQALRGRPGVTFLALILFVAVVGAVSFQWALNAVLHTRAEVAVPDLSGKNLDQALDVLSPLGLSLAKDGVEFDESSPAGSVLRQAPPAGLTVREGRVVRVTLSSGGKVSFVPELIGKSLSEAQNLLRAAGMAPGALTQSYSQARPQGDVLEQSPAAGVMGGRGQLVDLKVSKGPPPEGTLLVPDFVSKPVSLAREWARENDIRLDVSEEPHAEAMPGVVLRQEPPADVEIEAGGKVSLTAVSAKDGEKGPATRWVRYQVPTGGQRAKVKVVLRDDKGEKVLFEESREPGALVEVPLSPQGAARARIYLGGILVEERVLE